MRPDMITQTIRKQILHVTHVEDEFPENSCVFGIHRKCFMGAPELHKTIPAKNALCNRCPV